MQARPAFLALLFVGSIPVTVSAQTPVRVMTWNIQVVGAPGTTQYEAARQVLARLDADVVGINEVSSSSDVGNLAALASDAGYGHLFVPSSAPSGGLRNAVLSRYPIVSSAVETSASLSGDPGANDLARDIVVVTVDVPQTERHATIAVMHWKSSNQNVDEFRRAVESYRVAQSISSFDLGSDAVIVVGDVNEELDSVPRSPSFFTSLPSGLPSSFSLGADAQAELSGPGFFNDPFSYVSSPDLVVLDARQLDGSDATRPSSGRRLDYVFVSTPLRGTTPATEVYDARDEGLPGGLPKAGAPLSASTTQDASDHFPVVVDVVVPAGGPPPPPPPSGADVWINELHYDNVGGDTGEGVEIAGTAGTDVTGWSVVLYNGNGGTAYRTVTLQGTLPNQSNGFGTLDVAIGSIQNGAPDAVALIDDAGAVVEFLSYEGALTATDGPAAGQSSQDIGVEETSSTPIGTSLQRVGSGATATDFVWAPSSAWSFGAVNAQQSFVCTSCAAEVWINELHYDNAGSDTGEGVEVAGDAGTDLSGWSIVAYNGNGQQMYLTHALGGVIPAQSNGHGTIFFAIAGLQNGAPDAIALVDDQGAVVEFLGYEGVLTAADGPAAGLTCTDIGVFEDGSTPVGSSLQRSGSGSTAADFVWSSGPSPNTYGAVNTGQTFTP